MKRSPSYKEIKQVIDLSLEAFSLAAKSLAYGGVEPNALAVSCSSTLVAVMMQNIEDALMEGPERERVRAARQSWCTLVKEVFEAQVIEDVSAPAAPRPPRDPREGEGRGQA